jgi:hypothetical protein
VIQLSLPLTLAPAKLTFGFVREQRERMWREQSERLLELMDRLVEHFGTEYESAEESHATLFQINRLSIDLSALNPRYLDLSCEVFDLMLDYDDSKRSVLGNRLRNKYERFRPGT